MQGREAAMFKSSMRITQKIYFECDSPQDVDIKKCDNNYRYRFDIFIAVVNGNKR